MHKMKMYILEVINNCVLLDGENDENVKQR